MDLTVNKSNAISNAIAENFSIYVEFTQREVRR